MNKCYSRIPLLNDKKRSVSTNGSSNGEYLEAANASSTTNDVKFLNHDEALRQISVSVARGTKHLKKLIKKYNAMSANFFNPDRLNESFHKAKKSLKLEPIAQIQMISAGCPESGRVKTTRNAPKPICFIDSSRNIRSIGSKRPRSHLIEVTFNKALMENTMPPKMYSTFLQSLLPQYQM